jgi:hypothetical protein
MKIKPNCYLSKEEQIRRILYKIRHEESYPYKEAIKKITEILQEEIE